MLTLSSLQSSCPDLIPFLQSFPLNEIKRFIDEDIISFSEEESRLYLTHCVYPLFEKGQISSDELRQMILLFRSTLPLEEVIEMLILLC